MTIDHFSLSSPPGRPQNKFNPGKRPRGALSFYFGFKKIVPPYPPAPILSSDERRAHQAIFHLLQPDRFITNASKNVWNSGQSHPAPDTLDAFMFRINRALPDVPKLFILQMQQLGACLDCLT
jgi:hypothetical protein